MTSKEYLSQAYRLDQRIASKLEMVESLNELAMRCTTTITGMPRNPSKSTSPMADTVLKIIDLQDEINRVFFARPISLFVQSNFRSAPEREFYAS
jgi:hypothetical protein